MFGYLGTRSCLRNAARVVAAAVACMACTAKLEANDYWKDYPAPDWRKYQAKDVPSPPGVPTGSYAGATPDRFTFADLKSESDESLARRLLGQAGARIALIDRHRHRWRYYQGDSDGVESIDLYTRPHALGSQFGLCGVEKYSIDFDDEGRIDSVGVSPRYGVEGPIFQKADFDWDRYYKSMCASAPATHAPSYFPAPDPIMADQATELLVALFDIASSPTELPFKLECPASDEKTGCRQGAREYIGALQLDDIDEFSLANCTFSPAAPNSICFTIVTGVHQLGPFPKHITVRGSTYLHNLRIDSVDVRESFTMS